MNPYWMVGVNLLLSSILLVGIGIYRYIWPKKPIHYFPVLVLFSLLLCVSMFRQGSYESGDFGIHIYRTISFYHALAAGYLLPSWAAELNATYGYPLFIFNYPLPYYLISFFHVFGFSFVMSMKLFLASITIGTGITMYLFARNHFKHGLTAFIVALFYQFAPYHLVDLHFKVVIGELVFYLLLPLAFLCVDKLHTKKHTLWILLGGISVALLIMAHVVLAFFACLLLCAYVFFQDTHKRNQLIIPTLSMLLTGVLLSSYIWATPFFLSKYTIISKMDTSKVFSVPLQALLYSPYRFGLLFQGPKGQIANLIGYTQLFVVGYMLWNSLKGKNTKEYQSSILFWLGSIGVLIFLITPISESIWKLVPFIGITGNHRLLVLVCFATSLLAGYFSKIYSRHKTLLLLLVGITIFSTILNWGQRRVIPGITDITYIKTLPQSTAIIEGHFYANSYWRDPKNPWFRTPPMRPVEIVQGYGKITHLIKQQTLHTFTVTATEPIEVQDNTLFFPGWHVIVDGKEVAIHYQQTTVITFSVSQGVHHIRIWYTDIPVYESLKHITLVGWFIVIGLLLKELRYEKKK